MCSSFASILTVTVLVDFDETVSAKPARQGSTPYINMFALDIPLSDGKTMTVTDYASAGKVFSEKDKIAVWILTQ